MSTRTFNLADLFEINVDASGPDREAVIVGDRRLTYHELDARANRLAHFLADRGVGAGDHIGLQMLNGSEYLEGMLAAFKIRAVPININYRYVRGELRHLFTDADLVALVAHRRFMPTVAEVVKETPKLTTFVVVDDDSGEDVSLHSAIDYEKALAEGSPERGFGPRSSDDIYIAYTGGTTGLPKGVVWRHEDIFYAALGGGDIFQVGDTIKAPDELGTRLPEFGFTSLPTPPFMHVSAHWLAMQTLYGGGKIVVPPVGRFDAGAVWSLVEAEKVNMLIIVGDAMGGPLVDALAAAPDRYDTSSLIVIGSGGAVLSPATKDRFGELLPNVMIIDGLGSSETGVVGNKATTSASGPASGPRFSVNDQTTVLGEDHKPVQPGSGTIGVLARRGHIPLGYYNDPEKTAATFVEVDGVRWVLPGDMATVEEDGTVVLLGRGSVSINTGGEKVYPEEVEVAVKSHPGVGDAVIVGVPDPQWGERVVAVVCPQPGVTLTLEDVQAACRDKVAGYKVPRDLVLVDEIVRSPSGKTDYRWARDTARERLS